MQQNTRPASGIAGDWANEKEEVLHQHLRRLNCYRNKTRSIRRACRALVERFDGKVTRKLEDLLALPGVGRKTANIIIGNAFSQPAIGVDTHVTRLSERLGLTKSEDPDKIETDLVEIVPKRDAVRFCHLLQFHGRQVCTARNPDCPQCSINWLCPWPYKTNAP